MGNVESEIQERKDRLETGELRLLDVAREAPVSGELGDRTASKRARKERQDRILREWFETISLSGVNPKAAPPEVLLAAKKLT